MANEVQVLKATAAAVTLGTGASLGPEGPSVEIGTAAARVLGGVLRSEAQALHIADCCRVWSGYAHRPDPSS